MIIEQTVEIHMNHRVYFEVPPYIPEGKATIKFSVIPSGASPRKAKSWRSFRGIFKDSGDTVAGFLERMRADKELEDEIDKRHQSPCTGV
jgi:hypothetical protein